MRRLQIVLIAGAVLAVPAFRAALLATERSANLTGVPISQEKHHHLVLENSYVQVYEVEIGPHEATLLHQHVHDYATIALGECDLTDAVVGKLETRVRSGDTDTAASLNRGMFSHKITNHADTPFRSIDIELQRAQGEINRVSHLVNQGLLSGDPDSAGMVTLAESEEVRLAATGVAAGASWSPARDERDRLVVMIDKIYDTSGPKEHNSPFPAGMLAWVPAGKSWSMGNPSAHPMRLVVLEFKDSSPR